MSTTVFFPVLVIAGCIAAIAGLNWLATLETRVTGKVRLAPTLLPVLLAGVAFLFYLDDAFIQARSGETVRRMFHLPDDVTLISYGRGGDASCYTHSAYIRRSVQFTPEQFARYVGSVHDRSIWRPVIPPHYTPEKSRIHFPDDALVWHDLPEPPWMGSQQMVWSVAGEQLRRGLAQCYAFNRVAPAQTAAQTPADDSRIAYSVAACNPRARPQTPTGGARVTAALDSDMQRLNVTLHFDSKPDYCNNRLSKWLDARLGLTPAEDPTDVQKR